MARIGMTARLAPVAVAACVILSAAAHGPASADLLLVDRVVAVVGRRPVLDSDVREGIMAMGYSGAEAMAMADSSPSYVLALEQLVEEKLIVEGAWRLGLFPEQPELQAMVDEEIDAMRSEHPSEESFLAWLASSGLTMDQLRSELGQHMSAQYGVERLMSARSQQIRSMFPTDAAHYLAVRADLVEDLAMPRHLAWIRIPVLPTGAARAEQEAFLVGLRERIISGETDFAEAAREYSDDLSADSGGDLGYFGPDEMTPAFGRAAFSLEEGEVSWPIVTPFGVHLILVEDVDEEGDRIRASHILRSVELTEADFDSATALASSVAGEIRAGLSFEDAVAAYSSDWTTIPSGGDIGTILVRWWAPFMEARLTGLEPGDITEPFLSDDGGAYIIARVLDGSGDSPGGVDWTGFDEPFLEMLAEQVVSQEGFESLVDSLRSEIPVVYAPRIDET
ncbi:peptidylprolyl isomerase [Candidatus Fermentibacterales bacterium]|nr:peptidylprolyl isomerase [Candidatus Fermentibacterales bacterium]